MTRLFCHGKCVMFIVGMSKIQCFIFLISNFRLVLNAVCFLLGNSQASEFYMPTFRNTLFHLHRLVGMKNGWVQPSQAKPSQAKPSQAKVLTWGGGRRLALRQFNAPCLLAIPSFDRIPGLYKIPKF